MTKIFLQIGAARDGQNPYYEVAKREGYLTVLIEMVDFIDYQSLSLTLPFDRILPLDRPDNPYAVMHMLMHAGLPASPQVVLAGFEAYNACAGRIREMLLGRPGFIALDKYAQRMALKKAQPGFPQPEFRFFASPMSVRAAREALIYPCVIKPVDGGGGLGIWLIHHAGGLDRGLDRLLTTLNYGGRAFSGFIVESWLAGHEYSLQGVVYNGKAQALTCCQKVVEQVEGSDGTVSFCESGHVGIAAHALPAAFDYLMRFCCETFGYRQGAFHIDFIVTDGVPHFLEMGFRLSGIGVVNLVEQITGLNWAEIAFHIEQGRPYANVMLPADGAAVGQLRIHGPQRLAAAQRWVYQNQRGEMLDPLHFSRLAVAPSSSLYADLTHHAGMLATLRLAASSSEEIIDLFRLITTIHQMPQQRDVLCAE